MEYLFNQDNPHCPTCDKVMWRIRYAGFCCLKTIDSDGCGYIQKKSLSDEESAYYKKLIREMKDHNSNLVISPQEIIYQLRRDGNNFYFYHVSGWLDDVIPLFGAHEAQLKVYDP